MWSTAEDIQLDLQYKESTCTTENTVSGSCTEEGETQWPIRLQASSTHLTQHEGL